MCLCAWDPTEPIGTRQGHSPCTNSFDLYTCRVTELQLVALRALQTSVGATSSYVVANSRESELCSVLFCSVKSDPSVHHTHGCEPAPAMQQHRLALALCGILYPAVKAQHDLDPENYVYTSHSFQHPCVQPVTSTARNDSRSHCCPFFFFCRSLLCPWTTGLGDMWCWR